MESSKKIIFTCATLPIFMELALIVFSGAFPADLLLTCARVVFAYAILAGIGGWVWTGVHLWRAPAGSERFAYLRRGLLLLVLISANLCFAFIFISYITKKIGA